MAHIGEKIKIARESKGWTQSELAEKLSIEPPSVSRWESGKTNPKPKQIPKIAEALGRSVDWFQDTDHQIPISDMEKRIQDLEAKIQGMSQSENKMTIDLDKFSSENKKLVRDIVIALPSLDDRQLHRLAVTIEDMSPGLLAKVTASR